MEEAWRRSSHAIHIAGLSRCKDAKTEICECKKDHAIAEPTPLIVQKSEEIINKVAIEYPTLKLTRFPTSKKWWFRWWPLNHRLPTQKSASSDNARIQNSLSNHHGNFSSWGERSPGYTRPWELRWCFLTLDFGTFFWKKIGNEKKSIGDQLLKAPGVSFWGNLRQLLGYGWLMRYFWQNFRGIWGKICCDTFSLYSNLHQTSAVFAGRKYMTNQKKDFFVSTFSQWGGFWMVIFWRSNGIP